ncbi:MAG: FAD-dependent thymidylate synthase [Acidimicrobiales bacterium]
MFPYVEERFNDDEVAILQRYFTNVYGPVFALVNLPEVVKGALFARYSRSAKSLRRLFLDEFVCDLEISGDASIDATVGMKRAEELYERVFYEYGDDSVAQVGGVHLACEQASNLLTKVLEWGRLMAYLEQSTRYIGYDIRMANGHYRYHRPTAVLESGLGARYVGDMDRMFDTYGELMPRLQGWLITRFPRQPGDSDFVHRQAVRAKALDGLRGLLPAASLSNVGIYGSGQSYESLLLKMRSHPLPEARFYADLMLTELRKVIPSFLQRVDVSERGGEWSAYFADTRTQTDRVLKRLWPDALPGAGAERLGETTGEVRLVDYDPEGEDKLLAAICFAQSTMPEDEALRRVRALSFDDRVSLLHAYVGDRKNRRHRPGRAFERTDYRFEIVVDYGAFRDLQRHRLLTIEWQRLTPELGYTVPDLVIEAGEEPAYVESLERSRALYDAMTPDFGLEAGYAVALAHRVRCVMQMNAREALLLIELRSGTQGHPSDRRIAQQMYRAIAEEAGHRAVAEAMVHVEHGWSDLERLESERRAETKRTLRQAQNS